MSELTAEDIANLAKAYLAMRQLIDFCASSDCYKCIFREYCDTLQCGGFSDLGDAACSSLDLFPADIFPERREP